MATVLDSIVLGLKLKHASEPPRGLIKTHLIGPTPSISDSIGWGEAKEFTFLINFLVMLGCWFRDHILRTSAVEIGVISTHLLQITEICAKATDLPTERSS